MAKQSRLDRLPNAIRTELIAKLLAHERLRDICQWLKKQHGIRCSPSTLHRLGKPIQDKFAVLVGLGMPIEDIAKNHLKIEAIGIDRVRQTLVDKLTANPSELFAYLDKPEANQ